MDIDMIGPAIALSLPAIGSSVGCYIAGAASHAVMSRVEEGHGKYLAMSAAPSSFIIYGFLLMLLMSLRIKAGTVSAVSGIGIAIFSGSAILAAAYYQSRVIATAIQASAKQPAIYGKCWVAIGMIEAFGLFVFVFSLLIM